MSTNETDASGGVAAVSGGETASSTSGLGGLETLLKNAQSGNTSTGSVSSDAQRVLNAGFDPLSSLARNPALLSRVAQSVLPRSAPVSSLLPPLPPEGLTQQALLALQSQIASVGTPSAPAPLLGSMHAAPDLAPMQQLLAAQALAASSKASMAGSIASSITPNMQKWPLERLEQHVNLLIQLKQPVPESVSVLLADARRKEAKKTAKRLANRKSASSSRARKKALVQEMTMLNARLKRQAQILALLPDLVITINLEGVITFSSAQVERVLHHNTEDIVGAKLVDLVVPASRDRLNRLIAHLVKSEQMATLGVAAGGSNTNESGNDTEQALGNVSNVESAAIALGGENSSSEVPVVSEPSFPLSVVKVKAKERSSDENDTSDNSASLQESKDPSSLTQDSIPRSPTASSVGNSGSDDAKNVSKVKVDKKNFPSSDVSNSSSLSTSAKKLQKANQNLEKNVRAHNKKMKKKGSHSYHRDDVTGADVTANNASARLSSLQHRLESSSEEDSGYRESNDSREETSSSASDSSSSNGRRKPIAPTCTICLVRKDLSTIWCEVTSSIRTVEGSRDAAPAVTEGGSDDGKSSRKLGKSEEGSAPSEFDMQSEKELLLCLRPIRNGEAKVDGALGFSFPKKKKKSPPKHADAPLVESSAKPPKKRRPDDSPLPEPAAKKAATASKETAESDGDDAEAAVDSLVDMNQPESV